MQLEEFKKRLAQAEVHREINQMAKDAKELESKSNVLRFPAQLPIKVSAMREELDDDDAAYAKLEQDLLTACSLLEDAQTLLEFFHGKIGKKVTAQDGTKAWQTGKEIEAYLFFVEEVK